MAVKKLLRLYSWWLAPSDKHRSESFEAILSAILSALKMLHRIKCWNPDLNFCLTDDLTPSETRSISSVQSSSVTN